MFHTYKALLSIPTGSLSPHVLDEFFVFILTVLEDQKYFEP